MLMHQLLQNGANRHPDKLALRWVDRNVSTTYAQAVANMNYMAGALTHLGVKPGDRVTLVAHNGMDYLNALFGIWRIGAIAALVNVKFAHQLAEYFADHTPSVIIYTHDLGVEVRAAAKLTSSVRHLVCMDGPQEGATALSELMGAHFAPGPDPRNESAIAHLSYTSGTTGKPKGACLAHEPTVRAARCIAERLHITGDEVSFGPTALSSSYQLVGNLLPPLSVGAAVQVMGKWNQASGWQAMDAAQAHILVGNPTLLQEVLTESRLQGRTPAGLRMGLSGGGPVPTSLKKAWRDELKLPLVESFGQSELGGFMAMGFPQLEHDDKRLLRVGPALPDKEVWIADAAGQRLPPNATGEIVLRGGNMKEYWGLPEKTAQVLRGDELHTGDLGFMDAQGYITMRGRRSELVNVAGIDWYPRDIEDALCEHPDVEQAAMVGTPDAKLGRKPVAFVKLRAGVTSGIAGLAEFLIGRTDYDTPLMEIRAIDTFPMTPTGKIAKAELAQAVA